MNLKTIRPMTAALGVVTLGIAPFAVACSSGQTAAAGTAQGSSATTVAVRAVNGTAVLAGPDGKTLYTNNQDRPGRPMCTSSDCTAIWAPLTIAGAQPTAGTTVTGKVASVKLPDGARQVTWKGMPLYTFSFDNSAGQDNGNGVHDSFGGTSFVWHAAMTPGQQPAPMTSGSGSGSGFSY
jgi:predicted lipoprotein with Yx(FWY)xxD motif